MTDGKKLIEEIFADDKDKELLATPGEINDRLNKEGIVIDPKSVLAKLKQEKAAADKAKNPAIGLKIEEIKTGDEKPDKEASNDNKNDEER